MNYLLRNQSFTTENFKYIHLLRALFTESEFTDICEINVLQLHVSKTGVVLGQATLSKSVQEQSKDYPRAARYAEKRRGTKITGAIKQGG